MDDLRCARVVLVARHLSYFAEDRCLAIGTYRAIYLLFLDDFRMEQVPVATSYVSALARAPDGTMVAADDMGHLHHFRGSTRFLRGAATAGGLDVVTVANSHSLDFGRPGLLATLSAVRQVHVRSIGGGATLAQARRPVIVRVGGLRVALLGYTDIRPAGFDAGSATPGAAPAESSYVSADVAQARKHADVVVVWFHWGVQSAHRPDARDRKSVV